MAEQQRRLIGEFRLGDGRLFACAWSPDGARLAVGGDDNNLYLLDRDARVLARGAGHTLRIWSLAFSPPRPLHGGAAGPGWLASGSEDHSIRLWHPDTGAALGELRGHTNSVRALAWLPPDGAGPPLLVSGSDDGTVRLWDPLRGEEVRCLRGHEGWVRSVAVLGAGADGPLIASGGDDGGIRLWDPTDGAERACLRGHEGSVRALAWSADTGAGPRLASGCADRSIRIWDPRQGQTLHRLTGHTDVVRALAYAPDGRTLASGARDKTLRLWDADTGAELACLTGDTSTGRWGIWSVAFAPDGTLASAAQDGTLRLWDLADLLQPRPWPGEPGSTRPGPGSDALADWLARQAASVGRGAGLADRPAPPPPWVPERLPRTLGSGDRAVVGCLGVFRGEGEGREAARVALSPDGRRLYSGHTDGRLSAWDLETGRLDWTARGHTYAIRDLALSADGDLLASASSDRTIRLWDPVDGRDVGRLEGHTNEVWSVAFAPAPVAGLPFPLLASGSWDQTIRLWDPVGGREVGRLEGHTNWVLSVAFAPAPVSGLPFPLLASGSADQTIRLWDPVGGREVGRLEGHTGGVRSVAFAPAPVAGLPFPLLASASADQTIRLWDPATGREVGRLEGHTNGVYCVAFAADGRLASGAYDGSIRLWNPAAGTEIARLDFRERYAWRLAWAPGGGFLVSGNEGDTVRIWDTREGLPKPPAAVGAASSRDDARAMPLSSALGESRPEAAPTVTPAAVGAASSRDDARAMPLSSALGESRPEAAPTVIPAALAPLPRLWSALHRLGIDSPLSLLADLHALLSGRLPPAAEPDGPLAAVANHPGLARLRSLRWPGSAWPALLALLLSNRDGPWPGAVQWAPPSAAAGEPLPWERLPAAISRGSGSAGWVERGDIGGDIGGDVGGRGVAAGSRSHGGAGATPLTSAQLADQLRQALCTPPVAVAAPAPPVGFLLPALAAIDDRLLALLSALGPRALAADPGLVLKLRHRIGQLPALAEPQRRLLATRIAPIESGPAQGGGAGVDRAGLANRGPITALLPSQFALDQDLLLHKHLNGGLLYRARTGREPPRLRPTVILLDTGPACYGPVEAITRPGAYALAETLAQRQIPALLLGTGAHQLHLLDNPEGRLQILTARTLEPADHAGCLSKARALLANLDGGPLSPIVLLLTHCFFAAEIEQLPQVPGLRALFVRYPPRKRSAAPGAYRCTERTRPAFARHCERWECLGHDEIGRVAGAIGRLVA